jgi:hypothetical protein
LYQWDVIALAEKLLKPIQEVQKMLEGEKYPTASLVPICIDTLRAGLVEVTSKLPAAPAEQLAADALIEFAKVASAAAAAADAMAAREAQAELGGALPEVADGDDDMERLAAAAVCSPEPVFESAAKEAVRKTAALMLSDVNSRWGDGTAVRS